MKAVASQSEVAQQPANSGETGGFVRDVLLYLPAKALPAATGLLAITVISHSVIPSEYADYSAIITLCVMCGSLAGGWIQQSSLYLYPRYASQPQAFMREMVRLQALTVAPVALVVFGAALYVTNKPVLAGLAVFLLLVQVAYALITTLQRSLRSVKEQAISACVQSLVHISALLIAAKMALLNSAVTVSCVAIGATVGSLLAASQLHKRCRVAGPGAAIPVARRELVRQVVGYGVPFSIWFIAYQLMLSGDRLVLVRIGAAGVGEYASVRDLVTGLAGLTTMPLLLAAHPVLMAMWQAKRTPAELEQFVARNVNVVMFMLTLFVGLGLLCGPEAMTLILGSKYKVDRSVLCLVVVNIYAGAVSMYAHKGLEVSGQVWRMALTAVVVALMTLGGCALVAPRAGVIGTLMVGVGGMLLYVGSVSWLSRGAIRMRFPARIAPQFTWLAVVAGFVAAQPSANGPRPLWLLVLEAALALAAYSFVVGIGNIRRLVGDAWRKWDARSGRKNAADAAPAQS